MSQDREGSSGLPIACTLTPTELVAMRDGLLPGFLAKASAQEPIPGDFRWRFNSEAGLVEGAAAVIDAERRCCRFLRFLLVAEPDDGPVWLEVTGPEETAEFLSTVLNTPGASSGG